MLCDAVGPQPARGEREAVGGIDIPGLAAIGGNDDGFGPDLADQRRSRRAAGFILVDVRGGDLDKGAELRHLRQLRNIARMGEKNVEALPASLPREQQVFLAYRQELLGDPTGARRRLEGVRLAAKERNAALMEEAGGQKDAAKRSSLLGEAAGERAWQAYAAAKRRQLAEQEKGSATDDKARADIASGADIYVRRWQQYARGFKRIG